MRRLLLVLFLLLCEKSFSQTDRVPVLNRQLKAAATARERFGILDSLCYYYGRSGELDSLRVASSALLDIAKKEKDDSLLVRAYIMVNGFYWVLGNFPLSIEYSFKAVNLALQIGEVRVAARTYSNIAWAYINLKDYRKAQDLCFKSIALAKKLEPGNRHLMAAYDNLAVTYIELGNTDSALYYTQLANSLNIKLKNTYEQCTILDQFGSIYEMLNEYELAETYYRKAISLGAAIKEPASVSISCIHYGRLLLKHRKMAEAKYYALIGLQGAIASRTKRQIIESAEILQPVFEKQQRTDSAYYYSKMANAYRDSAFNEQRNLQVQNVTFSQQLYENEVLQKREEEALTRKQNLQYAAIGIGLISFIILFLLFSYSIIANQTLIRFMGVIALLLVFEFINLYLHPHIGELTHHSPFYMLLIMVGVAALLVPVHHKLEHWVTRKMVEKNQKIRLAAAKKTIAKLEEKEAGEPLAKAPEHKTIPSKHRGKAV